MDAMTTEMAAIDSRGSRVGMFRKIDYPVLETRMRGWAGHRPLCIRRPKHSGSIRESEGFIVPFEVEGQHNPDRGKGACFVHATKEQRIRGLPCC